MNLANPSTPYTLACASVPPGPGSTASHVAAPATCGCLDSTEILRGQKTVEIKHNGSTYRLQATRLGKLILTK